MSDYIENDMQDVFFEDTPDQLLPPDYLGPWTQTNTLPSPSSWAPAPSSPSHGLLAISADNDMQDVVFKNPDEIDWTTAQEEFMEGQGMDWDQFIACQEYEDMDQPAEASMHWDRHNAESVASGYEYAQPHNVPRQLIVSETSLDHAIPVQSQKMASSSQERKIECNFDGCKSSFKRGSELNRHTKKHEKSKKIFTCSAVGCSRTGDRAFSRADKMREHVLAGHNADALFKCAVHGCACGITLPKDMMTIHHSVRYSDDSLSTLGNYRCCPFNSCKKRYNLYGKRVWESRDQTTQRDFGHLQAHLLNDHTVESRSRFADIIRQHGYYYHTLEILCPVCPGEHLFRGYVDFYRHFLEEHCTIESTTDLSEVLQVYQESGTLYLCYCSLVKLFRKCRHIPDQVRQHRLTIVRLWPEFIMHPVWDDVRRVPNWMQGPEYMP